ncbi:hypothetical protein HYZ64_01340 [Candidatus Berkelbacteria bacterium]|nr:hypothetical protein [Candidatus Berkelbacteria bacterium]
MKLGVTRALLLSFFAGLFFIGVVHAQTAQIGILGKVGTVVGKLKESLNIKGGLVLSCQGLTPSVEVVAGTKVISDYCATQNSLLAFDPTKKVTKQAAANIVRLNRDVARVWTPSGTVTGSLCLRCPSPTSPQGTNPDSFPPEGRVWRVDGDLALKDIVFQGRGTVIVNGNLTIEGNATYDPVSAVNSSVGFIVITGQTGSGGNIIFKPSGTGVQKIVGAYLATGTVSLNDPAACSTQPLDVSGSVVANAFSVSGRKSLC